MILIDWTNVAITSIMATFYKQNINEDLVRHNLLNALRPIVSKFSPKYGKDEIVLCTDNGSSWRKTIFKHYKSHRKVDREKSKEDWDEIFQCLEKITKEISENFPYKVLGVRHMEADDIIATLVFANSKVKDIVIVSNDKDFIQLQGKRVKQWSPLKKDYIKEKNPDKYLHEHILKGDRGDSIPNILSPEDCFVTSVRQTPVRQKKMDEWFGENPEDVLDDRELARYSKNKVLIDLTMIPDEYQESILDKYTEVAEKDSNSMPGYKIMKYLAEHNLNIQMEKVDEFL